MSLSAIGNPMRGQGLEMLYHPSVPEDKAFCRNHEDSMYLNVIRPVDVPRGKTYCLKEDTQALRTHDIEGACPRYPHLELYKLGPPKKDEIAKSHSRPLYPKQNKFQDFSLTTGDIVRAQPNVVKFKTLRVVDPLIPQYELPSVDMVPAPVPQPLVHEGRVRDTLEFKGESAPRIQQKSFERNPNEHRDIDLAQPNIANRIQRLAGTFTPRNSMRTVEQAGERILSSRSVPTPRSTCPLNPAYTNPSRTTHPYLWGEESDLAETRHSGPVPGSTPRVLHRDNGEPQASLIRRDIAGAVPQRYKGALPMNIYDSHEVTPYVGHIGLDCSDIPGAQTGTRKAGTL